MADLAAAPVRATPRPLQTVARETGGSEVINSERTYRGEARGANRKPQRGGVVKAEISTGQGRAGRGWRRLRGSDERRSEQTNPFRASGARFAWREDGSVKWRGAERGSVGGHRGRGRASPASVVATVAGSVSTARTVSFPLQRTQTRRSTTNVRLRSVRQSRRELDAYSSPPSSRCQ
jgi:hypothetical protein